MQQAYYEAWIGAWPDSKETRIYLFKTYPDGKSFFCSGNATLHSSKGLVFVQDNPAGMRDKLISIDGTVDDTRKILQALTDEIFRIGITPTGKCPEKNYRKLRKPVFHNKYYERMQKSYALRQRNNPR